MSLTWKRISTDPAVKRSSNSIAVVGDKAYIFGGETKPRTPVDDELYVLDLKDGSLSTLEASKRPSARVGSAMAHVDGKLYVWGGREGKEMSACNGDLWVYDLASSQWNCLSASTAGDAPADRSFHVLVAHKEQLYLHAGCPAQGRLETLHSLSTADSLSSPAWTERCSAPPPGRGGTVLCPTVLPNSFKSVLIRFGGFAGHEVGGAIDVYDIEANSWSSTPVPEGPDAPEARSVHALIPIQAPRSDKTPIAVMLFGERGPAPAHLGHDGAGQFHSDAWLLVADAEDKLSFTKLEQAAEGDMPAPRGWFASSAWTDSKVVVVGGLDDDNERLAEVWVGTLRL